MNDSKQATWLITGAAGALGQSMVRQLLAAGKDCIALDRDARGLNALHDGLVEQGLPAPALVPLDLAGASPDDYEDLAANIEREFGGLQVLVHNAAHFVALRPLEHQPPEEWMKILMAGMTGPWLLTRAMLPLLRRQPGSQIAWVSDRHCLEKPANWGGYGLSQAGRGWMAKALAAELGPRGPGVLDIDPGAFYSRLRAAAWPVDTPEDLPSADTAAAAVIDRIIQLESQGAY
jgi:NAD(P)-dependent dehydrogenase (short-subunit alcohol dehydrogenase family)